MSDGRFIRVAIAMADFAEILLKLQTVTAGNGIFQTA